MSQGWTRYPAAPMWPLKTGASEVVALSFYTELNGFYIQQAKGGWAPILLCYTFWTGGACMVGVMTLVPVVSLSLSLECKPLCLRIALSERPAGLGFGRISSRGWIQ